MSALVVNIEQEEIIHTYNGILVGWIGLDIELVVMLSLGCVVAEWEWRGRVVVGGASSSLGDETATIGP